MVHFERTKDFTNRALAIGFTALVDSSRAEVMQAGEAELLQEQKAIKLAYDGFMLEFEKNLAYLPKDEHRAYFNEVALLFRFSGAQLQAANDLTQQLFLQHGTAYQTAALTEAKAVLQTTPLTEEVSNKAAVLLLIATGGLAYYQQALAEVERQLRLADGLVQSKTDKASLDAIIEKYVPAWRTSGPTPAATPSVPRHRFSLRQLALQHIYEGKALPRAIAPQIAAQAGYTSPTSGQQLVTHYNALAHPSVIASEWTEKLYRT